jgi:hypothetical protein
LNEAALRQKNLCGGRYRVPAASDIGDLRLGTLQKDGANLSLGLMVRSMNFDLNVSLQVFAFSITSKPKSIENT